MPFCQFCERDVESLVKSHIIPRSFYKLIKADEKHCVRFTVSLEGVETPFKRVRDYDQNILCEKCERLFSPFDEHGFEVLTKTRGNDEAVLDSKGVARGLRMQEADYFKLKMFLLSVLWRASVSTLMFFENVNLGPHQRQIRDILANGTMLNAEAYSILFPLPLGPTISKHDPAPLVVPS